MRYILIILLYLFLMPSLHAQDMPAVAANRVRVTNTDEVLVFDLEPYNTAPETDASKYYSWYGANEIHLTQGGYSGKLLNGRYSAFYLNKQLKSDGTFDRGLKAGLWRYWNADGTLLKTETWEKGQLYGRFMEFGQGGALQKNGNYKNGLLDGYVITYNNGKPADTVYYKNGQQGQRRPSLIKRMHLFEKSKKADTLAVPPIK